MTTKAEKRNVYLDHAAATPLSLEVQRVMEETNAHYGNPSSIHRAGREARFLLESARARIAAVLGAAPEEIIFTGSGSEGDALAIVGAARARASSGRHIIVSAIEHKAVLAAARELEREGFTVTKIVPDHDGRIDPKKLSAALRDETILVSFMYANNEIGTIEPLAELAEMIRARRGSGRVPLFHTGACQAPGMLPLRVKELGVDLMTLNSSKIYGPKGIGALYVKTGVRLMPLIAGGGQERGLRGGTESVALACGFAEALVNADRARGREVERLTELRSFFFDELRKALPQAVINGHLSNRLANNIHVSIPDVEGESLLLILDTHGIACATGSACNANDLEPSHVLLAIGQGPELAHGSLRFTMGRQTTRADILYTVAMLVRAVEDLRNISASTNSYVHAR